MSILAEFGRTGPILVCACVPEIYSYKSRDPYGGHEAIGNNLNPLVILSADFVCGLLQKHCWA